MFSQRDAIARLLRDDDPETVRMVKEQLALGGEDYIPDLRDLVERNDERVSRHARDVMAEIAGHGADDEFLLLCHFFSRESDFENACWMLSQALGAKFEIELLEHKVNLWGRQFLVRTSGIVSNRQRVLELANFMAGELCFRGNTDDYYCERNSLLPSVIETRMGIPLTLTLLYIMVARRAGLKVDGINLPGHFIARHGGVLFDPFHKGRILTGADCEEILARQKLKLRASYLEAASPRQILLRLLANLLYVYDLRGEQEKHRHVKAWVKALSPAT